MKSLQRLSKEFHSLVNNPSPGISVDIIDSDYSQLVAAISGPPESPYAGGTFLVKLEIPPNYPFEAPKAQFITPIYHPNIDAEGRICLDTLKPQPQGSWSPSINLNTLLLSLRLLMGKPNAEDGLVPEIIEQYKRNRAQYSLAAQQHTLQHAAAAGPSDSETLNVMSSDSSGAAKCDAELMCIGGSSSSSDDVGSAIYSNPSNTKTDATIQDNAPHSTVTLAESTASVCADVTSATMLSADVGSGARMYGAATWQEVYQLYSEGYTLIGCNDCTRSIQRMQEVDMNAALCGHESAALDVDTEGQGSGDIEQDSVQRNAVDSSRLKRKR